ncbi:protein of unknown function (plasmid) [Caballeronia sp. S22]
MNVRSNIPAISSKLIKGVFTQTRVYTY